MTDILERLYFGEIRPAEKEIANDAMKEKYRKLTQAEEEVINTLSDLSKGLFKQYLAMSDDVNADAVIESYKDGFRTAVRLILAGLVE